MNTATLTIITLFACGITLATLWTYERMVRDLRYQIELKDEHLRQCEHLLASMVRHPAGQVTPDLRIVSGNEAS